jgi:hypothetical protein
MDASTVRVFQMYARFTFERESVVAAFMLESERTIPRPRRSSKGTRLAGPLRAGTSPEDQRYERENYEHEEENLRDACCAGRNTRKTKNRCDECNDEKNYGPIQHVRCLS